MKVKPDKFKQFIKDSPTLADSIANYNCEGMMCRDCIFYSEKGLCISTKLYLLKRRDELNEIY